jgi:hypothetical protein
VWCTTAKRRLGEYRGAARRIDSLACHDVRGTISGLDADASSRDGGTPSTGLQT